MTPMVKIDQKRMGHIPHPPSLKCSYAACILAVLPFAVDSSPRVPGEGTARDSIVGSSYVNRLPHPAALSALLASGEPTSVGETCTRHVERRDVDLASS